MLYINMRYIKAIKEQCIFPTLMVLWPFLHLVASLCSSLLCLVYHSQTYNHRGIYRKLSSLSSSEDTEHYHPVRKHRNPMKTTGHHLF